MSLADHARAIALQNPSLPALAIMRALDHIQLKAGELRLIIRAVRARARCNLLVFGVGNDSTLWRDLNTAGRTIFLEDNSSWLSRVLERNDGIDARLIRYDTRRTQWREMLGTAAALDLALPEDVENTLWDVILVDAPAGWHDSNPGRMRSIAAASRLAPHGADVFVHDCDREIEQVYSSHYLGDANLVDEVGRLRHYRRM